MSEEIKHDRHRFLRNAVTTFAAAKLVMIDSANAPSGKMTPMKQGAHTSFGSLKQIDAGLLNVGYAEAGPANGPT